MASYRVLTSAFVGSWRSREVWRLSCAIQIVALMAVEGLRDSLAQGDKRFLRVREIGERVLGVEHYIDVIEKYGTKEIEGTSDTADAEVQNNAWDYAEIYNRLLLRYLKSHGEVPRGTPPIREFWPGTTEMTKMMHAFAEGRSRSFRRK